MSSRLQPVGTGTVEAAKQVTQHLVENGNIVSVGYMLRYLRCVQKMKQIIHENNLTVMATNARFVSGLLPSDWVRTDNGLVLCIRGYREAGLVEQGHRYGPDHRTGNSFLRLVTVLRWGC